MENQHEHIVGYRDLSQEEIVLINGIKLRAHEVGALITDLEQMAKRGQLRDVEEASRWVAIAKTHLQQGFMAAVRAVAQPDSF